MPLLIGGQAMIWLTWPFGTTGALGAFGGTVLVCLIWRLLAQGSSSAPQNYLRDVSATIFLAAWIPLFGAFGALLIYPDDGWARVLSMLLAVVFSDIGGYTAGVLFGKHPMVPAISPKKSWEGFAGSLLCGTVAAVLAVTFLLDRPPWIGIPLGIFLVITGHPRRPGGIPGQARPGHQGHGHAATGPRRHHGPPRLDPAVGRGHLDRPDAADLTPCAFNQHAAAPSTRPMPTPMSIR